MGNGAICHTLNPRLFEDDLAYIINHAQDSVILADASFVPVLTSLLPRCPTVKHVVLLTDERHMPKQTKIDVMCYEDLLMEESPNLEGFKWEVQDENQGAGLCYTSGTTGMPKGVMYTHRSNFLHALAVALPDCLDVKSTSTILMVVPMFHANSWGLAFAGPMMGAKLVLPGPYLDGASVYKLLEEHKVTTTAGVPTVWLGLLDHMEKRRLRLSTLRLVVIGGAACPRHIIEYLEVTQGVEVRQLWGMTETSPTATVGAIKGSMVGLDREGLTQMKLKQGRPHIFIDMRIVDESGTELPWDGKAFGNLQVRGPHTLSRYYNSEAAAADAHGWFDTGDVATIDPQGFMQITDRSKDVIKSGGEWISSVVIENVAVGHPQVAEAAVIAIPDPKWTERPLLVVAPQPGQTPTRDDILSYLSGKIARWWMPDDVVFVKEIPHTATGKISKLTLRKQWGNHKPPRARM
ncbi:long-chain-fatty-acid-ligase [Micractinium conductrix]|uniref:Long-chain-fatty-acid-ligase n=1 Tax=Micractinium conductrix TaxID=554055 RepID=A0A2P6VJ82_9CHLO|nr:long-chain-fatty-acid-ligase [Micractinium conductrix]|eukprot:PSC74120.1 long-chain-fatty-acid-ligase [Micractinium conductrix]